MRTLAALFQIWTWRMAWRDARSVRGRLLLFSTSISLGIAALVSIGSLNLSLRRAIGDQAKALVGADLVLTSRSKFGTNELPLLDRLGGERADEVSFTSMLGFPSIQQGPSTRLVNVRALTGGFPFYGSLETEPRSAAQEFRYGDGVLVEESVARQFGVGVGSLVRLGTWETHIAGLLRKVPGDAMGFNTLAPRVYMAGSALSKTGLLKGAALARYRLMLRFPEGGRVEERVAAERAEFRRLRLDWDTVQKRERSLGRSLEQLNSFLNLVAYVALLLGAVGVASAIRVHVQQRLAQVAVLRCLGARSEVAVAIYLAQSIAIGACGAVLGVVLGSLIPLLLRRLISGWLPFTLTLEVSPAAIFGSALLGMAITSVFALLPLLAVRRVPPLAAIRGAAADAGLEAPDRARWWIYSLIGGAVLAAAMFQTRHWYQGVGFAGGLGGAFLLLALTSRGVMWLARRCAPAWLPFAWRQGFAGLHRPQNRTTTLLVALGLGTFLLLTLQFVRSTLLTRLFPMGPTLQPNMMLFDIQPDQREDVLSVLAANGLPILDEAPIITMRLKSVRGRNVRELQTDVGPAGESGTGERGSRARSKRGSQTGDDEEGREGRPPGWVLTREYRSTWRTQLASSERLTAGAFIGRVAEGTSPIPVSVEEGIAKDLGLGLGSRLEFDIQGLPVECEVASLRTVEWRQVRPNFFFVFPGGALEAAPAMHILATRTKDAEATAKLQRELFQRHPNVSSIDIGLVLETLDVILSRIGWAIRLMTLFTVVTGLVVLAGAMVSGRWQRARECVLLRTLGASRSVVRRVLFAEYAALGLMAAVVGWVLAMAAGWAISRWVFEVDFHAPWGESAIALGMVPGLTVAIGLLSSRGLSETPPLEILRKET